MGLPVLRHGACPVHMVVTVAQVSVVLESVCSGGCLSPSSWKRWSHEGFYLSKKVNI